MNSVCDWGVQGRLIKGCDWSNHLQVLQSFASPPIICKSSNHSQVLQSIASLWSPISYVHSSNWYQSQISYDWYQLIRLISILCKTGSRTYFGGRGSGLLDQSQIQFSSLPLAPSPWSHQDRYSLLEDRRGPWKWHRRRVNWISMLVIMTDGDEDNGSDKENGGGGSGGHGSVHGG